MSWLGWIIVGGIAGALAGAVTGEKVGGCLMKIVLGVVGGVVGGAMFSLIGGAGVTGLNLWSLFVAFVGSVVVLVIARGLRK